MGIAGPTVFLALRAIGGIPEQIGQIRVIRRLPYLVQQLGRRMETPGYRHIAVHFQSHHTLLVEGNGLRRSYLYILESFIIELGRKMSSPLF